MKFANPKLWPPRFTIMFERLAPGEDPSQRYAPAMVTFASLQESRFTAARLAELEPQGQYPVSICIGSSVVTVCFSRSSGADALAERYGDLLTAGPVRRSDFTLYVIEDGDDAFFWAAGSERVWRWTGGPLSDELLVFFADNAAIFEFLCNSRYLGFHAAVLAGDRSAAALIGETTAGKTTTALACVRRGSRLYSDERCILEDGLVVPFLRRLSLRAGGRAALLADPVPEALGLDAQLGEWQRYSEDVSVRPSRLLGARAGGPPLPLSAVFLIDGRGAAPELEATDAAASMPSLLAAMASRESRLDRLARVLHELRGVNVYRLRLGAPDASAGAILAAFEAAERARVA